jgi:aryl-phospho-beta-D-glucosidase BglC (GH1 family)
MQMTKLTNFLVLFLVLFQPIYSQNFLSTSGTSIVNQNGDTVILRGMGLGGWMVQEGYMMAPGGFSSTQYQIKDRLVELIGAQETEIFYDNWLRNHVRKIDIDSMKQWGFNLVRAPIHYNLFTEPIENELSPFAYTEKEKGYELLDSLLEWCKQNEIYLMIDLHAAPGGQGYNADISDYDPTKPSLWESQYNQNKTVELWKRIARRYKNEEWIAGYDLINEPNWDIPGGVLLRELYQQITEAIRAEGDNHILFIEGNWFANDFTGLTPPWDDNFVYSPHKYWSPVDQGYLDWMLPLRDSLNVPLFIGETGENSNFWYRDAVKVFEENGIGWAWWPFKRIGAIQPPLSINYNEKYKNIVDYWNGEKSAPSKEDAIEGLRQLTDDIKLENNRFQKDVIDALFRQPFSNETVPYTNNVIPGKVFASDFDMGIMGEAYYDAGSEANYGGDFSAWNNGWGYRNDNVDIQSSNDPLSNEFNVGWIERDEWMKYSFNLAQEGLYNVKIRVATEDNDGRFYFKINDNQVSDMIDVPSTGAWDSWSYVYVDSLVLNSSDNSFVFHVDRGTFNLGFFEFERIGDISLLETRYMNSFTLDKNKILLNTNKDLKNSSDLISSDFQIAINNNIMDIKNVLFSSYPRSILIEIDQDILPTDSIYVSYNGTSVRSTDNNLLSIFSEELVNNTISFIHTIPGKIEAEHFFFQKGMELENTSDEGEGFNVGSLDNGDYADYYVDVQLSGTYNVTYRVAADPSWSSGGQIELSIYDSNSNSFTFLQNIIIPATEGWQDWEIASKALNLDSGKHQIRLTILGGPFNLNWFSFDDSVSVGIPIPGYVQAEDFIYQDGISLEMTEDDGGGQNIGYLDSADYVDYIINVTKTGLYDLSYRVASDGSQDYADGGTIKLLLMEDSLVEELHTISFPATEGWQDWVTFNNFPKIYLESGDKKIRLLFTKTPFNLNWILFDEFEGSILGLEKDDLRIKVYPNPTSDIIIVESTHLPKDIINYTLVDISGKIIFNKRVEYSSNIYEEINLLNVKSKLAFLIVLEGDSLLEVKKIFIKK